MKKIIVLMLIAVSVLMAKVNPALAVGECSYTDEYSLDLIGSYAYSQDIMFACQGRDTYYEVTFDRSLTHLVIAVKHSVASLGYDITEYRHGIYGTYYHKYYYDDIGVKVKSESETLPPDAIRDKYNWVKDRFNMKPKSK